jgi:ADP-ribosylarginine hydrolase
MVKNTEKIEASLMLGSYFETLGYKNGSWEFNYQSKTDSFTKFMEIWTYLLHHYLILGGSNYINIKDWNSSDDTILILATAKAVVNGGGEDNYKKEYVDSFDLLLDEKRASGINTIDTIKLLKRGATLKSLPSNSNMGGNGAAIRTGPIGLKWYKNIEKIIEESICASRLTHNYYLGFLGGMVVALFTGFAMNNIPAWKWTEELIKLYTNKTIHKFLPGYSESSNNQDLEGLDEFMGYWKRYQETRISKLKYKNSLDTFVYPTDRTEYLMGFYPNPKVKSMVLSGQSLKKLSWDWNRLGGTGLDSCIYALDCLLMSMQTPNSKLIDLDNVEYSWDSFMTLVSIHPGDSDSTGAIGGTWFGALNGFGGFDKGRVEQLEFYKELKKVSDKIAQVKV